jgi:hypothetical protein
MAPASADLAAQHPHPALPDLPFNTLRVVVEAITESRRLAALLAVVLALRVSVAMVAAAAEPLEVLEPPTEEEAGAAAGPLM